MAKRTRAYRGAKRQWGVVVSGSGDSHVILII
jgi:hypothetical protein